MGLGISVATANFLVTLNPAILCLSPFPNIAAKRSAVIIIIIINIITN